MRSGRPEIDRALAAGERAHTYKARLGGVSLGEKDYQGTTVGGYVQSWAVERTYNTDLPTAMRAFGGGAAAQLDLDLSGSDEKSAPRTFSPWAPRWPGDMVRPGQSVTFFAGVDGLDLPAFRGTVRARSAVSGTDTVKITALDGTERLRGRRSFPIRTRG
ncbi:hypothetical protein ACSNOK_15570 [Streptomyces sp. URMC 126]|uniref:hypothetical protein n=1 Tax=Streptomyces sp. URMC 126 TaxID=3423401 RepID=UPI003F1C67A3